MLFQFFFEILVFSLITTLDQVNGAANDNQIDGTGYENLSEQDMKDMNMDPDLIAGIMKQRRDAGLDPQGNSGRQQANNSPQRTQSQMPSHHAAQNQQNHSNWPVYDSDDDDDDDDNVVGDGHGFHNHGNNSWYYGQEGSDDFNTGGIENDDAYDLDLRKALDESMKLTNDDEFECAIQISLLENDERNLQMAQSLSLGNNRGYSDVEERDMQETLLRSYSQSHSRTHRESYHQDVRSGSSSLLIQPKPKKTERKKKEKQVNMSGEGTSSRSLNRSKTVKKSVKSKNSQKSNMNDGEGSSSQTLQRSNTIKESMKGKGAAVKKLVRSVSNILKPKRN